MNKILFALIFILLIIVPLTNTGCMKVQNVPSGLRFPEYIDFLTLKYDAKGNQLWEKLYRHSQDCDNYPVALSLDSSGNIYVTGTTTNDSSEIVTVKYDSVGNQLWELYFNNQLEYAKVAAKASDVDKEGNLYIVGTVSKDDNADEIIVLKYNADGQPAWEERYRYPESDNNRPSSLVLDKYGNVYITATVYFDGGNSDYLTLKYNSQGKLLWLATYDSLSHKETASKLSIDDVGNVYITGKSLQNEPFDFDYVTVKYNADGELMWVAQYNGPGNNYDVPHDLKLDIQGNVVVTGESDDLKNVRCYATIKYNSKNGKEIWASRYQGVDKTNSTPSSLVIDLDGNVYVTGESAHLPSGSDCATIKYDSEGNQLWVVRYPGDSIGLNRASNILLDQNDNIYVAGSFLPENPQINQFIAYGIIKYDSNGNELWVVKYKVPYSPDTLVGFKSDKDNNVVITGPFSYYEKADTDPAS